MTDLFSATKNVRTTLLVIWDSLRPHCATTHRSFYGKTESQVQGGEPRRGWGVRDSELNAWRPHPIRCSAFPTMHDFMVRACLGLAMP